MSFDDLVLWLLLPIAAASGWLAARFDLRRQNARALPTAYFKGLNFLLNEQPDKAIEVFVQALEVNSETVETHLALGNLFRRRGEVDRAIRIHQNLIARPTLDKAQRAQALLELGQDYLKAGLFDRAENLFLELVEMHLYNEQALRFLMNIYQQEREWQNAIDTSRKYARVADKNQDEVIAQYSCELAEEAIRQQDFAAARRHLEQALAADRRCVRANILLGDVEAAQGRHAEAIKAWREIENQDAQYLSEVADRLGKSYRALDDVPAMQAFFADALKRHGGSALLLVLADIIERRDGAAAAEAFITEWLRRQPSVHGLYHLVQLKQRHADAESQADLKVLHAVLAHLRAQHQGYICLHCGFRGRSLHWQCPGCNRWNSVRPAPEKIVA